MIVFDNSYKFTASYYHLLILVSFLGSFEDSIAEHDKVDGED